MKVFFLELQTMLKSKINTFVYNCQIKKLRKRLKNHNFTILSENCIGGIIYNRLGEKFLTPTINMWQSQKDFIKFVLNLEFYLNQPLEFLEPTNIESTPVAKCYDITLHFNHSNTPFDAENDWNKRKVRINYNNIYILFYDADNLPLNEIRKIEDAKCKNIAFLTNRKLPLKYAVKIKPHLNKTNGHAYLDKNIFGLHTFERKWNFVKWLNSEQNYKPKQ